MNAPDRGSGGGGGGRVRASDAEREQLAKLLESAAGEGRLNPEEAGERLAAASAAVYREELSSLITDLPSVRSPDIEEHVRPPRSWWLFSAIRLAFVAMLVIGFWGFWGMHLLLWPLGFMAIAFFLRPWRRRRRWQRWQRPELRGSYRF